MSYHRTNRYEDPFNEKPIYDFDYLLEVGQPEPPRKPHEFPTDGHCPQCGSVDHTNTGTYFHCTRCGTVLWNEEKIPLDDGVQPTRAKIYTPSQKPKKLRIVPCHRCGRDVLTRSTSKKVYCEEPCRKEATREYQRQYHRTYSKRRAA